MKIDYHEIYANRSTKTGISALSGEPLVSMDQLPEYRLDIHVFRDSAQAGAFVDGLLVAGLGNNMTYDREPGTTASNRMVIVARLDEPRPDVDDPAEAIRVVNYRPDDHDTVARTASMAEIHRERDERYREEAADRADLVEVVKAIGGKKGDAGSRWLRFMTYPPAKLSRPEREAYGFTVTWENDRGRLKVRSDVAELLQGNLDVSEAVIRAATDAGVRYDPDERELLLDCGRDELPDAVRKLEGAYRDCDAARRLVWHQAFVDGFKMTGPRRRFLAAAAEQGYIRSYIARAHERASAGGIDIGKSEINGLVKVGWIRKDGRDYQVTEAGLEAAGIEVVTGRRP